jgi:hypothetical protein
VAAAIAGCDRNYRQAISVIGDENLLLENCTLRNTKGTPPETGIDSVELQGITPLLAGCPKALLTPTEIAGVEGKEKKH